MAESGLFDHTKTKKCKRNGTGHTTLKIIGKWFRSIGLGHESQGIARLNLDIKVNNSNDFNRRVSQQNKINTLYSPVISETYKGILVQLKWRLKYSTTFCLHFYRQLLLPYLQNHRALRQKLVKRSFTHHERR